jgi:hypothetical protein
MPDTKVYVRDLYAFARAVLKKAQEKWQSLKSFLLAFL